MSGIALLRRLLMKQAMKKSKDASGIMSLNKGLVDDVERQVSKWADSAKRQGQDIDKMGEQELKYLIELNKPKGPMIGEHRVIDATSAEGQGITDQLTKQLERLKPKESADVLDLSGKKIDTSKPILGGKNVPESEVQNNMEKMREFIIKNQSSKTAIPLPDIVTETIAVIKSKKPIDAMAEANLVIARKGKYKNLTIDESQDILKKTNDHIFERDIKYDEFGEIIKPDPEDLAGGGRASSGLNYLLGEDDQNVRVPYKEGSKETFPQFGLSDPTGQSPSNIFGIGFGPALGDVMKEEGTPGPTVTEDVLRRIKESPKEGLENIMLQLFRDDPDNLLRIYLGIGPKRKEIGIKKQFAEGGRIGFGLGGIDKARRAFLKLMGAGAATGVAAKSGLFSLLKAGKPTAQVLTSVPIKAGVDGMPVWFKPLVNKIIKTGDEVESGAERVIVHSSELPGSKTKLFVTQELDTGNVMVDVGIGKHGFGAGHHGQPVRLEYKAAEDIMTGPDADDLWKIGERDPHVKTKSRKEFQTKKTKEEFWVEEAEFTGGHPENIKFEESVSEKFGSHGSNFDEVEKFATGKVKKVKPLKKAERAHWTPEGDMASGGRVPLGEGGDPGMAIAEEVREAWKDYLKEKENGTFKGSWKEFQPIWIRANLAQGGRVPLAGGKGVMSLIELIIKKFGKDTAKRASQLGKPQKTLDREMFQNFNKKLNPGKDSKSIIPKDEYREYKNDFNKEILNMSPEDQLRDEFPGISDRLIRQILTDTNPQRIAEVKQTMREALKMQEKGMGHEEIIEMFKKTPRTKNASGGRVSLSAGGLAGMLGE